MRIFKLIGVLACVFAVSAVAVTIASASILPGTAGTTITGGSERVTLQVKGGAALTCKGSTVSGEILSVSEGLAIIDIKGCTVGGLAFVSLGDASGTILEHVEIKECPANPEVLELTLLPVHLEVPASKLLLTLVGTILATVETQIKQTTYPLAITQKEGKNEIETCGKEKLILLMSTDGAEFVQTGEEAKAASLTFGAEEEFM